MADSPVLRLSRSPISAPPLSYWHDDRRAIVANVERALFATGEARREIDEVKLDDALFHNYGDEPRSWFVGVRRVPAGHRIMLSPGAARTERYYDIAAVPEVRCESDEAYVERADALLAEATAAALDGFSRPAISLSGGLDSQAVAAHVIRQRPGQPLFSFTSVPETAWDGSAGGGVFGDERRHVEALAAMYPELHPTWVDAAGLSFDHKAQALFMLGGYPPPPGNLHWAQEVSRLAGERRCDVLLIGDLGNFGFSFTGSGAMPRWLVTGRWRRLWRELAHSRGRRWRLTALMTQAALPLLPRSIRIALYRYFGRAPVLWQRGWCPLREDHVKAIGLEVRSRALGFDPYVLEASSSKWRAGRITLGETEGANAGLAFSELHQVPFRDPTAYRPLVEFCLGIPDDQYLRDGQTRWLARRMLRGIVPDMVVDERRWGVQSADWHLRLGRIRQELIEELDVMSADPMLASRIDFASLRNALVEFPPETPLGTAEAHRLQAAVPRAMMAARFVRYVQGTNA